MSVEARHPQYTAERVSEWKLCSDAMEGESAVKSRGKTYLPMPNGFLAMADGGRAAYDAYRTRAQFPEIMSPSVGAMIGIIHGNDVAVEIPPQMEYLREDADGKGNTLEDVHKRITRNLLSHARIGVLTDAPIGGGSPYLATYKAPAIINWDTDFFVLDESGPVRKGFTWEHVEQFRVLRMEDGRYVQTLYRGGAEIDMTPTRLGGGLFDVVPFVIAGARDLSDDVETPPLIGVARAALANYQLSADYRHQLYMSGQETLVVINGEKPDAIGAGVVHEMQGSEGVTPDMKYVGPSCIGIDKHKEAMQDNREIAVQAGARLFEQSQQSQESGEARKMRFRSETANLQTVAQSSCAALEAALRHGADMLGLNRELVNVTPPKDLLDATISPQDAATLWGIVMEGGMSEDTYYDNLRKGGLANPDREAAEEFALIRSGEGDEGDAL